MKKIGVFYGSNSGNTQHIAEILAKELIINKEHVYDVAKEPIEKILDYEILLLGSSTWGYGDVQDDWDLTKLEALNLSGKHVAVFGVGDSSSYPDTFCDAMGQLAEAAQKAGAILIGKKVDAAEYSFDSSLSEHDGLFCGLAIDEDNESDQTELRIKNWIKQLKQSIDLLSE